MKKFAIYPLGSVDDRQFLIDTGLDFDVESISDMWFNDFATGSRVLVDSDKITFVAENGDIESFLKLRFGDRMVRIPPLLLDEIEITG